MCLPCLFEQLGVAQIGECNKGSVILEVMVSHINGKKK